MCALHKSLRVSASDLTIIRLTCKKCNTVTEVEIERCSDRSSYAECCHCGTKFYTSESPPRVIGKELHDALQVVSQLTENVSVEFVIPDGS